MNKIDFQNLILSLFIIIGVICFLTYAVWHVLFISGKISTQKFCKPYIAANIKDAPAVCLAEYYKSYAK